MCCGEGTRKKNISFCKVERFVLFFRNISFCGLYTESSTAYGLVGNLTPQPLAVPSTPHCYILYNNVIHKAYNGTATIAPGRAYFDLSTVQPYTGTHAKALRVSLR